MDDFEQKTILEQINERFRFLLEELAKSQNRIDELTKKLDTMKEF